MILLTYAALLLALFWLYKWRLELRHYRDYLDDPLNFDPIYQASLRRRNRHAPARKPGFPWLVLTLCLIVGYLGALPTLKVQRAEQRLNRVLVQHFQRPMVLKCGSLFSNFLHPLGAMSPGFVEHKEFGLGLGRLTFDTCKDLVWLLDASQASTREVKLEAFFQTLAAVPTQDEEYRRWLMVKVFGRYASLMVAVHEAVHLTGERNEARTDCVAMQHHTTVGQQLGLAPSLLNKIARFYWAQWNPRMPANYQSPDCRPGGALDAHLPDPPWDAPALAAPMPRGNGSVEPPASRAATP